MTSTSLGNLLVTNPLFPYARVQLPAGSLTISAPDTAPSGAYVQSVTVNGTANQKTYLPQAIALGGGQVDVKMGSDAKSTWGTGQQDAPPPYSADGPPSVNPPSVKATPAATPQNDASAPKSATGSSGASYSRESLAAAARLARLARPGSTTPTAPPTQ